MTRTLLLMGLGAAWSAAAAQTSLTVVELHRSQGSAAAPFGTIGGMLEIAPGTVLITDDVNKAVWRWEPSGGRVSQFARDGRGPGEVATPVLFARRPGGGFALYDPGHASVLFFDDALAFEHAARLQQGIVSNPKSLAILADGSFIVSGGRLRDPRHLHRYAPSGAWIESYGDPSPRIVSDMAKIQSAGGAVRSMARGFLFSHGAPLRIVRFPANDFSSPRRLVEDVQFLPELTEDGLHGPVRTVGPGLRTRPFLWYHDRTTGVFVLSDGRILNVVTRFDRGDSVWDLYAADGRRIARTVVPRAWYAWDLGPAGHVLASYRDPDTDESIAAVLRIDMR